MFEVGRVCVKIAGRDAGKKCVVVDVIDGTYVMIDGMTRRRKCNMLHLEPLLEKVAIKKNATHEDVAKALSSEPRQVKTRQKTVKPKMSRKKKAVAEEPAKKKKAKK